MPALLSTDVTARILWLGLCKKNTQSIPVKELSIGFSGIEGDRHTGLTRRSCGRVVTQYPLGTEIRNTRQISIVAAEELEKIAETMGVRAIEPDWLGANIVVQGLPDFSHIPPSSRLQCTRGATVCIDMENRPCNLPAKVIEAHFPGKGCLFKKAAKGRRGVTAWVEREGLLRLGDVLCLHVPSQEPWVPG